MHALRLPAAIQLLPGMVIGTIHSPASLKAAEGLKAGDVDLLEVRVDAFANKGESGLKRLKQKALELPLPLVITVRDAREGGAAAEIPARERKALHYEFMEAATLIDLELRNAISSKRLIAETRTAGRGVILSCHDFKRTPSLPVLKELARKAVDSGATVFKLATTTASASDFSTLLQFLTEVLDDDLLNGIGYSVMGMGEFGKVSRLALAKAGSVLNYGFLHKAQVPGQWPAPELKLMLADL